MRRFSQFAVFAVAAVLLAAWLSPRAQTVSASDAVTVNIPATSDGSPYGFGLNYLAARGTYGGCYDTPNVVGQTHAGQFYAVYRAGMHFKLGAIPAGATVMYARLTATITADNSGADFAGRVERVAAPSPVCGNGSTWYGAGGTVEGDLFDTGATPGVGARSMLVDPAGITPGGNAAYLIRSSRDVAASPPSAQETVTMGAVENGTGASLLVVYYP